MSVGKVLMQEDSPHVALASFLSYACIFASWVPRDLGKATTWFGQGNGLNEHGGFEQIIFERKQHNLCIFQVLLLSYA